MAKPTLTDYITLIFTLFDKFEQQMNLEFRQNSTKEMKKSGV